MLLPFLLIIVILLIALWAFAPHTVPWAEHLTRLNAGSGVKAEWMAPPTVVEQVIWNYRESQGWLATCALNWSRFAERIEDYATGAYLQYQRSALNSLIHSSEPRITSVINAKHEIAVRYFSSDGLRCMLIDRQTSRLVTTMHYWSKQLMGRQHLNDATLIYQMFYDTADKRWKIEKLLQEFPAATGGTIRITVTAEALTAAGRDS